MEPALSAEDWADIAKYGVDCVRAESGPRTWTDTHTDRLELGARAVAAVALQESGGDASPMFTWEDVDALRKISWADNGELGSYAGMCECIADRIAALLPPRER